MLQQNTTELCPLFLSLSPLSQATTCRSFNCSGFTLLISVSIVILLSFLLLTLSTDFLLCNRCLPGLWASVQSHADSSCFMADLSLCVSFFFSLSKSFQALFLRPVFKNVKMMSLCVEFCLVLFFQMTFKKGKTCSSFLGNVLISSIISFCFLLI